METPQEYKEHYCKRVNLHGFHIHTVWLSCGGKVMGQRVKCPGVYVSDERKEQAINELKELAS